MDEQNHVYFVCEVTGNVQENPGPKDEVILELMELSVEAAEKKLDLLEKMERMNQAPWRSYDKAAKRVSPEEVYQSLKKQYADIFSPEIKVVLALNNGYRVGSILTECPKDLCSDGKVV